MIFISAGHNPGGPNPDPGAVANGVREADLAVELRDLVVAELTRLRANFRTDDDRERLAEYLRRIQPGEASVVCEIHFNAGPPMATGTETIVPARASTHEIALAKELSAVVNNHTGLIRRGKEGVISEADSHRGSLALMREAGMNALMEICFITNRNDLIAYRRGIKGVATGIAAVLMKYDDIIK